MSSVRGEKSSFRTQRRTTRPWALDRDRATATHPSAHQTDVSREVNESISQVSVEPEGSNNSHVNVTMESHLSSSLSVSFDLSEKSPAKVSHPTANTRPRRSALKKLKAEKRDESPDDYSYLNHSELACGASVENAAVPEVTPNEKLKSRLQPPKQHYHSEQEMKDNNIQGASNLIATSKSDQEYFSEDSRKTAQQIVGERSSQVLSRLKKLASHGIDNVQQRAANAQINLQLNGSSQETRNEGETVSIQKIQQQLRSTQDELKAMSVQLQQLDSKNRELELSGAAKDIKIQALETLLVRLNERERGSEDCSGERAGGDSVSKSQNGEEKESSSKQTTPDRSQSIEPSTDDSGSSLSALNLSDIYATSSRSTSLNVSASTPSSFRFSNLNRSSSVYGSSPCRNSYQSTPSPPSRSAKQWQRSPEMSPATTSSALKTATIGNNTSTDSLVQEPMFSSTPSSNCKPMGMRLQERRQRSRTKNVNEMELRATPRLLRQRQALKEQYDTESNTPVVKKKKNQPEGKEKLVDTESTKYSQASGSDSPDDDDQCIHRVDYADVTVPMGMRMLFV